MKKCRHPHVVQLVEVIDDPQSDKMYLVLEYLPGGELKWRDERIPNNPKSIYTKDEVRSIFRDLVAGVQYLHYQGIVHRDIKPANMLWTSDRRIKITDFGVSVFVSKKKADQELNKTAGSPAFLAPELCNIDDDESMQGSSSDNHLSIRSKPMRMMLETKQVPPPNGAAIDIWAMGVTLFCLLFGRVPFVGQSEYDLFQVISKQPYNISNKTRNSIGKRI